MSTSPTKIGLVLASLLVAVATTGLTGCEREAGAPGRAPVDRTAEDAGGDRLEDFGDYVVHYNALTTDQLPPEVARAYRITRSKSRAMVNVVIIKKVPGTIGKPVRGEVSIAARNLTGQAKNLDLEEIVEEEAIYYIGDVPVINGETLVYDVSVLPEGESERFELRFRQQFFTK